MKKLIIIILGFNFILLAQNYRTLNQIIPDFKVNVHDSLTKETQRLPSIAVDGEGNFVITWIDANGYSVYGQNIYAQRFSADGTKVGPQFKVNNSDSISHQHRPPGIASDSSGNFMIVWIENYVDSSCVVGQYYDKNGYAVNSNFRLFEKKINGKTSPSIVSDNDGNFIVAWIENSVIDDSTNISSLLGHRFQSDGTIVGDNIRLLDSLKGYYKVKINSEKKLVVVFSSNHRSWLLPPPTFYAQLYSMDGIIIGERITLFEPPSNPYDFWNFDFMIDYSGNFVLTWQDDWWHAPTNIYALCISKEGFAKSDTLLVNEILNGVTSSYKHSISSDNFGTYIITWINEISNISNDGIYGQCFQNDGTLLGNNFMGTNVSIGLRTEPKVKLRNGRIYNVWTDTRKGGLDYDIWANVLDWNAITNFTVNMGTPYEFELTQNFPNPFNPSTTIEFNIPKISDVKLKIYNVLGQLVATLVNKELQIGKYKFEWEASDYSSGVYFYQLKAGVYQETRKMVLMK